MTSIPLEAPTTWPPVRSKNSSLELFVQSESLEGIEGVAEFFEDLGGFCLDFFGRPIGIRLHGILNRHDEFLDRISKMEDILDVAHHQHRRVWQTCIFDQVRLL